MESIEMLPGIYNTDIPLLERLDYVSRLRKISQSPGIKPPNINSILDIERIRIYTVGFEYIVNPSKNTDKRILLNGEFVETNITEGNYIQSMILDYGMAEWDVPNLPEVIADIILEFNTRTEFFNQLINSEKSYYDPITPKYIQNLINHYPWGYSEEIRMSINNRLRLLQVKLRTEVIRDIIK